MKAAAKTKPGRDLVTVDTHTRPPELVQPELVHPLARIGFRVSEWSKKTGTSKATTYRRIADGTLETIDYGGLTLVTGLAGKPAA
jgi:hypothetical protein